MKFSMVELGLKNMVEQALKEKIAKKLFVEESMKNNIVIVIPVYKAFVTKADIVSLKQCLLL